MAMWLKLWISSLIGLMAFGSAPTVRLVQAQPEETSPGRFVRLWWFEPGLDHGNPMPDPRFRVNALEVVLDPRFAYRKEVRSSGMMQIRMEEDLLRIEGAELYLELWGGHPGTVRKRVTLNGRTTYEIPEVGSAAGHCTHQYPTFRLKRTDLVSGYNALQFACDQGASFWGHFIVDNACLRTLLPRSHPDLQASGLRDFDATVAARPDPHAEAIELHLQATPEALSRIARVDYYGFYEGYDENGNTLARDWHGMSKHRRPYGHLGSAETPPFAIDWDTSMLPGQQDMAVRAAVTFKDAPLLIYETGARTGLAIPAGRSAAVKVLPTTEKPTPFWSRAGRQRVAAIVVDADPARIERAELHTVVWDGGRGNVREYFTFNGRAFEVAGNGHHDVIYTHLEVPPGLIRRGRNEIVLRADTDHHGIEILEPGPALVIRYRTEGSSRE